MARKNTLGNSWMGLDLDPEEERFIKKDVKDRDISGRQLLRYLVRQYIASRKQNKG